MRNFSTVTDILAMVVSPTPAEATYRGWSRTFLPLNQSEFSGRSVYAEVALPLDERFATIVVRACRSLVGGGSYGWLTLDINVD